jgi:hypothetical protein
MIITKGLLFNILRILHILNDLFVSLYIFIFRTTKYDIYYLSYVMLIYVHWFIFNGECLLSYMEKKLLDIKYKMGDDIFYSPYRNNFNKYFLLTIDYLKIFNLCVIFYRNIKDNIILLLLLLIILTKILYDLTHIKK